MLYSILTRGARVASVAVACAFCTGAAAQDLSWIPREADIEKQVGQYLSKDNRQSALQTGLDAVQKTQEHLSSETAQRGYDIAREGKRRFDQAANAALEDRKAALMKFLGYEEDEPSGLYYLVTWEMPIELLRAYVREARWTGGTLVFRGIPEGRSLSDHILQDYVKLTERGDPVGAPVTLDPRMFDMFEVQTAPTIVLVEDVLQLECDSAVPRSIDRGEELPPLEFKGCSSMKEGRWWKVAGSVTTQWALETMSEAGSAKAAERLEKYKTALRTHRPAVSAVAEDGVTLRGYTGEWEQALTTEDLLETLSQQRESPAAAPWTHLLDNLK